MLGMFSPECTVTDKGRTSSLPWSQGAGSLCVAGRRVGLETLQLLYNWLELQPGSEQNTGFIHVALCGHTRQVSL